MLNLNFFRVKICSFVDLYEELWLKALTEILIFYLNVRIVFLAIIYEQVRAEISFELKTTIDADRREYCIYNQHSDLAFFVK